MTPYTRHQLLVLLVVVLGAGLGLAAGHWRRTHPDLVERLERFDHPAAPPPAARRATLDDRRGARRRAGAHRERLPPRVRIDR